ncbi:MAG: hypothetical protein IT458_12160 [Planctomycetes bacterium]|nr:hypothetical protein [Planctomycetota bacterium]
MSGAAAQRPAAARRRGLPAPWLSRAGALCLLLLLGILPALIAGRNVDAAAAPGEVERLHAAVSGGAAGAGAWVDAATRFAFALAPADDLAARLQRDLPGLRVVQVVVLAGAGLLLLVFVAVARGALRAALTILAFAALPCVAAEGHVVRPEVPGLVGALLAAGLLATLARHSAPAVRGPLPAQLARAALLAAGAGLACGTAAAFVPAYALGALVPGLALLLVVVALARALWRIQARRPPAATKGQVLVRRVGPWLLATLGVLWLVAFVLRANAAGAAEPAGGSPSTLGLLPAPLPARLAFGLLLGLGALRVVRETGARLWSAGRLDAGGVLLLHAGLFLLLQGVRAPGLDATAAAPWCAWLAAEGAWWAFWLLLRRLRVSVPPPARPVPAP